MDKEDKKQTLQMVNEWVRFCDAKAGIFLALQGAILTIIFTLTVPPKIGCNPASITFVLGFIFFGISILIGLNAIVPVLEVGAPNSKIFFGHIANYSKPEEYISEINSNYKYEEDVLIQIWANSRVAWKKFTLIKSAILWGVIGFTLLAVSYWIK